MLGAPSADPDQSNEMFHNIKVYIYISYLYITDITYYT